MKKKSIFILVLIILLIITGGAFSNEIKIEIDNTAINFPDAKPFVNSDNRTLVPVRFIAETMGCKVDWDGKSQVVTITGNKTIRLKIAQNKAIVNGVAVEFDTKAILKENRTFVPLRFIVETLGGSISWNVTTNTASINLKENINNQNQVTLSLDTQKQNISQDYFGFNTNILGGPSWNNEQFLDIIKEFNPQIMRYPGGTSANYWDWKTGWFVDDLANDTPNGFRNLKMTASSTLDEFAEMAKETGITPIYVLNMETSTLEYQLEMLRHAEKINLPVKYIELGNEFYFGETTGQRDKFPTSKEYALECIKWAKEIKKEFPDAKVAALGFTENPRRIVGERQKNWNSGMKEIIENSPYIDAVTLHPYTGVETNEGQAQDTPLNVVFAYSFIGMDDIQETKRNLPNNKEIWITEYNIAGQSGSVITRWSHGLVIGNMMLGYLEDNTITMALYHSLIGNANFTSFFKDEYGLRSLSTEYKTKPYALSSAGIAIESIYDAMGRMTSYQKINFNNLKELSATVEKRGNYEYSPLVGYKFSNSDDYNSVIINLSNKDLSIDLRSVKLGNEGIQTELYSKPTKVIEVSDRDIVQQSSPVRKVIQIKAYSINIFK